MKNKKERIESFSFKTKKTNNISFIYDYKKNGFIIDKEILEEKSLKVEKSYKRNSGKDKILTSILLDENFTIFNVDEILKKEYEHVIAIDTNSKEYDGDKISICTCYYVPGLIKHYRNEIPYEHLVTYIIRNPIEGINPEKIGWSLVLKNNIINTQKKVAVVVDSEKDSLNKFNKKFPYHLEDKLDDNINFVYASDKDIDSLAGSMIKMCHNASNLVFEKIKLTKTSLKGIKSDIETCEGYVQVKPIKK